MNDITAEPTEEPSLAELKKVVIINPKLIYEIANKTNNKHIVR